MVYQLHTFKRLYHLFLIVILLLMFVVFSMTESMCGKPGLTPNCAYDLGSGEYHVGQTVSYYCKETHCYVPSSPYRECLADGSWSGTIPFCYKRSTIEDIDQLVVISGTSILTPSSTMDRKNVTCFKTKLRRNTRWQAILKKSFRVIAVQVYFPDRTELSTQVQILEDNRTISKCENTGTNTDWTWDLFVCPHGVIGNKIEITAIRPQMSGDFHICEVYLFLQSNQVSACLLPDMPYQSRGSRTLNPSTYVFECNENYEPIGENTVTCLEDGTWTKSSFKCQKRIGCGKLPEVANGVLRSNSTTINSTAWLECNEGFRPLSDNRAYCLPTEKWTTLSFSCELIKCDKNPEIPHGKAELPNGFVYGSKLHITCDRGYMAAEPTLRECQKNGYWENLNICTQTICGPLKFEDTDAGQWVSLNETVSIRVLICQIGHHIEGSPAVTQCLPNGSWSHTTAVCRKTPNLDAWNSEWTPNTVLLSAVAVGAGTAICILCVAMCCLVLKKRRHKSTNSSVFHVGVADSILYPERSKDQQNYKANTYEDVIELRNNPSNVKPRKPSSALPNLPIFPVDTDPVYAQPFETSTAYTKTMPVSTSGEIYTAHIYAEPVDSNRSPSGHSTFTSAAETWLRSGAKKFGRKMSLPGRASLPEDPTPQLNKNIDSVYKSVCDYSNMSSLSRKLDDKQKTAAFETKVQTTFSELISNSIYLDTKEGRFHSEKDTEQLQMIDNDIYQDDYFSNV